jgi:hypothetical protein
MNKAELHDTHKAILYARWLAEKEGLPLPDDAEIAIDWAHVMLRDGSKAERIRTVTFNGERFSVAVHLPGWAHDPTPYNATPN